MQRVATLTANPTIDKNTAVEKVNPEEKLRCERPRREPGGGGINVSRAISRLGGESRAVYMAGGPTGDILTQLLDEEKLSQRIVEISDWTRENLIVYEESSGKQYRFGMPGPEVRREEWQQCLDELAGLDPAPEYIVASGSLAPGMSEDALADVARLADDLDARLIADTSGPALRHAVEVGTYLLKPNIAEFQNLIGEELTDEKQLKTAAQRLIDDGGCSVIVLSLGAGGALLVTRDGGEHLRSPTVPIRSKVGAGDSMVAGITIALARGMKLQNAARFGIAAGAAAVMTDGTELCRRDDTERLFEGMKGRP